MSKETARKLITELQTNEELKLQTSVFTDKKELVRKLNDSGYDVTLDELIEADHEYRQETAGKTDAASTELSLEELETVSGGEFWVNDDGKDGHELFCLSSYHGWDYSREKNDWCTHREEIDRTTRPAVPACAALLGDAVDEKVMCRHIYRDEDGTEHGIYIYG